MARESGRTAEGEAASVSRREEILEAAVSVFAQWGYYKATTAHVAERAGISQPYVFKFFKTKEELFTAALQRAFGRIRRVFDGVQAPREALLGKMIAAYEGLMTTHHQEIVLQVHGQTIPEEGIRETMRTGLREVWSQVENKFREAGLPDPEVLTSTFMANGMLCHVSAVLGMPEIKPVHKAGAE
ncbi:TetR/AcrR family transcriptional regulator [Paenibacillus mucilaginosus]|uniref:Transcriptional regulator n=3 Tax=Paenibacillus mucilaginosus TaxID=61624 RepID=H6NFM7_9BACL|nr:TetR/AcrR family transcriptional regulator [Paenibacillus mucilaginosus]AFC30113.1 transcriptional regulator [Paenibacillus mucilaginosus 3016]AFH62375.1 transcriptional regulator [Paenibacillus mucilaginosus K02]MCG7215388.1 TetR/AcrR family transcriptional regulator [Paenibacillus mucilaginosus]WDM30577.1 TetR/AcrR family transcriptional regulator [Paenibacillus mucilaginosus]WFA18760.1 TetR/AcrR family transcriptional regulator [Paenibacillus mucilaginosus]